MRVHILALAALSASGFAHAASIDEIKTGGKEARSIETIKCERCVLEAVKKVVVAKPELEPGTQRIEIRTVDGVRKIYRTEAWLGGSPVVFVSKAPESLVENQIAAKPGDDVPTETLARNDEMPVTEPASTEANLIDESATTAAVTADMGAKLKVEPKKAAFDAGKLELRLD